jgi:hypothetical protein
MIKASPFRDGKLRCCCCGQRYAVHLMLAVVRPSPRWQKRHYYCPRCDRCRRRLA